MIILMVMNQKNLTEKAFNNIVYSQNDIVIVHADSLEYLKTLPAHSISLIVTDPPYHSTKKRNVTGDTDFKTDAEYIDWMRLFSNEWKRVLKPNGSAYIFCSVEMSARLEVMFSDNFNILSNITWTKPNEPGFDGWKQKMKKESLRQWYPHSERVLFMEPSYEGNLYNNYFGVQLRKWRSEAGLTSKALTGMTGVFGKVNNGGAVSNWEAGRNTPSEEQYNKIIESLSSVTGNKNYPDYYDVIRPFNIDGSKEFTDVWNFPTVKPYKGKHPAEKNLEMIKHAIEVSSNEGDVVLDCFGGSGVTAVAAEMLNRKCISIDIEEKWAIYARNRVESKRDYSYQDSLFNIENEQN